MCIDMRDHQLDGSSIAVFGGRIQGVYHQPIFIAKNEVFCIACGHYRTVHTLKAARLIYV